MIPNFSLDARSQHDQASASERARLEQAFYERHANDNPWVEALLRAAIVPAMTLGVAALVFIAHRVG